MGIPFEPINSTIPYLWSWTLNRNAMKFPLIFAALMAFALTSCIVPKKKYDEMSALQNKTQKMLKDTKVQLRDAEAKNKDLAQQLDDCNDEKAKLEKEIADLTAKKVALSDDLERLEANCSRLDDNYKRLKARSSEKMQSMVDQLEGLQKDLAQREARLAEVENALADREARLKEVEKALAARETMISALRKRVEDALLGFRDQGLTVEVRNGKVYVSLSNKLLFASASTKIDVNGQKALRDLAGAIVNDKDLIIMVEGHTDDVPVSNLGDIKDNWDLSVIRSTEVVRYLVEYGLEPTRVIPSGRSEFLPKAEGKTNDIRAVNRRTEIIISPKLDELFELINQEP